MQGTTIQNNPNKSEIRVTNLFCKIPVYMCIHTHTHTLEKFVHTCTRYTKDGYRKA